MNETVKIVPANTGEMEPKVKWQAIAQYILGVVVVGTVGAVTDGNIVAELPDYISMFLAPIIPVIGGLASGYAARHQWRAGEGQTTIVGHGH